MKRFLIISQGILFFSLLVLGVSCEFPSQSKEAKIKSPVSDTLAVDTTLPVDTNKPIDTTKPLDTVKIVDSIINLGKLLVDTVKYTESFEDFPNPERGIWGRTIERDYFELGEFKGGPIADWKLKNFENDFNDIRNSKKKVIPRFRYTKSSKDDAPLEVMLKHLDQLEPLLKKHSDIIYYVEVGFIGAFGEWWDPRYIDSVSQKNQVLKKLLQVLPKDRMVALRYNGYKRAYLNSEDPLTKSQAFTGSDQSRIGHHNDCFLANEGDQGTYHLRAGADRSIESQKQYLEADNFYVPQGGETCADGGTSYATCERAKRDLRRMKWDNLNSEFYEPIIEKWEDDKCYEEIKRNLGYRFVLKRALFEKKPSKEYFNAALEIENVGYGKLVNTRKLEIVLKHKQTKKITKILVSEDPRFWSPGSTHWVKLNLKLPSDIASGEYDIFFSIQDPAASLYGIPQYAIRFANLNVWDQGTGYNNLNHTLIIP